MPIAREDPRRKCQRRKNNDEHLCQKVSQKGVACCFTWRTGWLPLYPRKRKTLCVPNAQKQLTSDSVPPEILSPATPHRLVKINVAQHFPQRGKLMMRCSGGMGFAKVRMRINRSHMAELRRIISAGSSRRTANKLFDVYIIGAVHRNDSFFRCGAHTHCIQSNKVLAGV